MAGSRMCCGGPPQPCAAPRIPSRVPPRHGGRAGESYTSGAAERSDKSVLSCDNAGLPGAPRRPSCRPAGAHLTSGPGRRPPLWPASAPPPEEVAVMKIPMRRPGLAARPLARLLGACALAAGALAAVAAPPAERGVHLHGGLLGGEQLAGWFPGRHHDHQQRGADHQLGARVHIPQRAAGQRRLERHVHAERPVRHGDQRELERRAGHRRLDHARLHRHGRRGQRRAQLLHGQRLRVQRRRAGAVGEHHQPGVRLGRSRPDRARRSRRTRASRPRRSARSSSSRPPRCPAPHTPRC